MKASDPNQPKWRPELIPVIPLAIFGGLILLQLVRLVFEMVAAWGH